MGLWFHCLNLVLLTQRASISKLLKPNFLYQAPETDTNFHRIIHFFPLKKKVKKRERSKGHWSGCSKGSPGQQLPVFTADTSLCSVLPEEEQECSLDRGPWSSSSVCTGELWLPDNTQSPCTVLPWAALAAKVCSSGTKQTSSLLCLQSVWVCCITGTRHWSTAEPHVLSCDQWENWGVLVGWAAAGPWSHTDPPSSAHPTQGLLGCQQTLELVLLCQDALSYSPSW